MIYEKFFNNTNSVHDYFKQVSYGKLNLTGTITNWIPLDNAKNYYGADSAGGIDDGNCTREQLITDALTAGDPFINYQDYNNIIGGINDQNIYIFKRIEEQNIKFRTLISEILSVYNLLSLFFPNKSAEQFINKIVLINEPLEELVKHIEYYLDQKDFKNASLYLERSAILYHRSNKLKKAAELYKSTAIILEDYGKIKKSIVYHKNRIIYLATYLTTYLQIIFYNFHQF
ncbi:MAG: immune inhibitor A domain-containing protein [Promethearchaeota archaeon]